jgi:hypothetical protein
MKQILLSLGFIFCLNQSIMAQFQPPAINYKKIKITDQILVSLPDNFGPLTEAEVRQRYVSSRRPIASMSDPDKMADFVISYSASRWGDDLALMQRFYKSSIVSMHTETEFLNESIEEINERKFLVFEFTSMVMDENQYSTLPPVRKYNYLMYTLMDGYILVFNFNTPLNRMEKWKPIADVIMKSVMVSEKKIKKTNK